MATATSALTTLANPSGSGGSSPATVPGGSQNLNPLGSSVFSTLAATSPTVATLPGGQTVPGAVSSTSPYPSLNITTPGGLATTGGTGTTSGVNLGTGQITGGDYTMLGDFQQTFGKGTGSVIAQDIASLGTSTSQALQTMDTAAIQAAQQQYGNMQANLAAQGVSPNSSTAALASADFSSQLTGQLASQAAGLGLSEEQLQLSALMTEGAAHGGDKSAWDTISSFLGSNIQGISGAISQGFGVGGKAGSILDAIAAI